MNETMSPVNPNQVSPLGLPVEAPTPVAAQDPFGIDRANQADKFAAIHAEGTRFSAPDFPAPRPTGADAEFKVTAPTAQEVEEAEMTRFMADAKAAAKVALSAYLEVNPLLGETADVRQAAQQTIQQQRRDRVHVIDTMDDLTAEAAKKKQRNLGLVA